MKTILVIEDAANLLRFVNVNLSVEGYRVLGADSGRKGLELARRVAPDLIVLDLMIPQMGGWELLARLKSHPDLHLVPVVILTASANAEEEARARRMGAVDYLIKPLSAAELVRRIKRALGSDRGQTGAASRKEGSE